MPYQSLELLPDEAGQAAVRRDWHALREAGLPSQLDHTGATNAPHLTVLAAPSVEGAVAPAVQSLRPLLPISARAAGLLLFGGERLTVARAVDVPDELLAAVAALRVLLPSPPPHQGWLPHVTLARRLPRAQAQRALDVLGHEDVVLSFVELRHWDPEKGSVTTLASR